MSLCVYDSCDYNEYISQIDDMECIYGLQIKFIYF